MERRAFLNIVAATYIVKSMEKLEDVVKVEDEVECNQKPAHHVFPRGNSRSSKEHDTVRRNRENLENVHENQIRHIFKLPLHLSLLADGCVLFSDFFYSVFH